MRPFDDRRARVHDLMVARAFIVRWTARDPAPANAANKKCVYYLRELCSHATG